MSNIREPFIKWVTTQSDSERGINRSQQYLNRLANEAYGCGLINRGEYSMLIETIKGNLGANNGTIH